MTQERDATIREARKQAFARWLAHHGARLAEQHPPAVASAIRDAKWRWIATGQDRPMDAAEIERCRERAVSRERLRRHGALDETAAFAQHAAIRAEWRLPPPEARSRERVAVVERAA